MARRGPVEYGFFSFTEITDPAQHAAYNHWHLYDHMPEQFRLHGVRHGQRWTRRAATGHAEAPLDAVHYVTAYLMGEPIERTLDEFAALAVELRTAGRFHEARSAHVAGCFRVTGAWTAPGVVIDPEAVPFRPHRGAHVRLDHCRDAPAYRQWSSEVLVPALLGVPGVVGAWTFSASSAHRHPSVHDLHVTFAWTDGDAAALDAASAGLGLGAASARLRAPLVPVTPDPTTWFAP